MNAVKWIAGASLAAVVTLGAVFAPGVGAQSVTLDNSAVDGSQFNRAQVMQMVRDGDGPAFGGENAFGCRGRGARGGNHMEIVAEQLGMTPEEIRAELQASLDAGTPKSIADLAAEQGVAVESIESAILAQMSEHLAQKVEDGDMTQEQADERLANASSRISERLSQPFDGQHQGRAGRRGGQLGGRQGMAVIIEQLGITGEELRAELQAGKSIADVAAEQGVSLDTLENALMDQLSEKLAERVANGDMTQEEADEKLAEASTRIQERLTQPGGQGGQRGEEGGRRGQRGQGGGQGGGLQNQDA